MKLNEEIKHLIKVYKHNRSQLYWSCLRYNNLGECYNHGEEFGESGKEFDKQGCADEARKAANRIVEILESENE